MNESRWSATLTELMAEAKKTETEALAAPKGAAWKVNLAKQLRSREGAAIAWIAEKLQMGQPGAVRTYLSRASGGS